MARLRHEDQRPFHEFRHGFSHLRKHLNGKKHPHTRQRSSVSERERKRRRIIGISLLGVGLIFVLVLVVSAGSALLQARSQLEQARHQVTALQDNQSELTSAAGRKIASTQLESAQTDANSAVGTITSSSSLRVLSKVPFLGRQITATESLAHDVATTALIGDTLLRQVDAVTNSSSGTSVSLSDLNHLGRTVDTSANDLLQLEQSSAGLLPPLGSARNTFNAELTKVVHRLNAAGSILRYLQYFVGGDGPRTFLLAAENQSEMRDQGAVLSLAQVHGAGGSLSVDSPVSVDQYPLAQPAAYPMPAGLQQVFGIDQPTQTWQSTNMTADFPWTGGDLVAMYQQATGVPTDGVVAVDVHALATVLRFSGPVKVEGVSGLISSGNVAHGLLQQLYEQNPTGNQTARKDLLSAVATASFSQLKHSHVDLASFAHALSGEIAGRHLLFYDGRPGNEAILRSYGASGAVDSVLPSRTFHLAVENASANKVDVFLSTSIHQQVTASANGTATVVTHVTIHNSAPTSRFPTYQLGPNSSQTRVPGEYAGIAYLWGPRGSSQPGGVAESGLVVSAHNVDILPGQTETVTFATVIPHAVESGHLVLHWVPQSTPKPQLLVISARGAGLATSTYSTTLDQSVTPAW